MPWLSPSYPFRFPLTIDHTQVGTGTHANIPVRLLIANTTLASRLRPDGIDLAVTDSDGSTALNYERIDYAADLQSRAAWSWYPGDRAVYHSGTNATYVTFADYANIRIGKYNHASNTWDSQIVRPGGGGDDHNHGCVFIAEDGSVLTVPLVHNDTTLPLYYSDGSGSITGWSTATIDSTASKNYNYPHLFRTTDGKLHCFVRRAPSANSSWRDIAVYTSTGSSAPYTTWGAATILLDAATAIQDYTYHKLVFDPATDTVYAVGGLYPGSVGSHSLYAFKMTWSGSAWSLAKLDGTAITAPMTAINAGTLAYTEVGSEGPWILDVARDGSGNLFALFATYPNADSDHRFWAVRTASGVFGSRESIGGAIGGSIAPGGGSNYYDGAACFNPGDPNEALISNAAGGTFEMQRWTYSAGSWSKAEDLTNFGISGRKNIRPFWIRSPHSSLKALWCEGVYTGYSQPNFDLQLMTYPRRLKPRAYITVTVPSLDSAVDKTLYLYAGNMAAGDQAASAATVYGATAKLVAHGRDKRDDGTKVTNEITGNSGVKTLASRSVQAPTPLFFASQQWNNSDAEVVWPAGDMAISGATALTIYALVNLADLSADHAVADNVVDATYAQYLLRIRATSGLIYAGVVASDSSVKGANAPTLAAAAGTTCLVGLVFDGAAQKVYAMKDGVLEQTITDAALTALKTGGTATAPAWGKYLSHFAGRSEELVIETVARSSGFLTTIKNMLISNATFQSLGTEEPYTSGVTVTPAALSLTWSVLAPSITGAANVTPAPLSATWSILEPTIDTGASGSVTVTPAALSATWSILAPSITGAANVTPAPLSATWSILEPTIDTGGASGSVTVIVSGALSATWSVLAVTVGDGFGPTDFSFELR